MASTDLALNDDAGLSARQVQALEQLLALGAEPAKIGEDGKPKWVWKEMNGGYAELLRLRRIQEDYDTILDSKSHEYSANPPHKETFEQQLNALATQMVERETRSKYQQSEWY